MKLTVSGSRHYVVIDKLEENGTYFFSVKGRTSLGFGPASVGKVTMGPQPGTVDCAIVLFVIIPDDPLEYYHAHLFRKNYL